MFSLLLKTLTFLIMLWHILQTYNNQNSLKIYEDLNFEPVNRSSQFFRVVTAISMLD